MATHRSTTLAVCAALAALATATVNSAAQTPGMPQTQNPARALPTAPTVPRSADPRTGAPSMPTTRPSLQLLQQLHAASRTPDALRRALASTPVTLRVERFCYVTGQHPARAFCTLPLDRLIRDEFGFSPADKRLVALALNDAWDVLGGGSANGGDLVACGGAAAGSVTDLLPMRRSRPFGAADIPTNFDPLPTGPGQSRAGALPGMDSLKTPRPSPGGAVESIGGADYTALVGACRSQQASRLRAGLGASIPGDARWGQAVQSATGAMDAAVAQCREDDRKGLISQPVNPGGGTTGGPPATTPPSTSPPATTPPEPSEPAKKKSLPEVLPSVAQSVVGIVSGGVAVAEAGGLGAAGQVVGNCTTPTKCVIGATVGTAGAVLSAAGVVTDDEAIAVAGSAVDATGALVSLATIAGGATGAAAILPVLGIATGTVGAWKLGKWSADAMSGTYARWAEAWWERKHGSGDAQRPAGEGGPPNCAEIAARWNHFKAYCSQPGNDWRSYDCMRFVARMNGCVDPGLVNPGPEGDYVCTAPCRDAACQAERRRYACEQDEKRRGGISRPNPDGGALSCAAHFDATLDLESQMRSRMCERASGEMGERCALGGPRTGASTSGALPAPRQVSPALPRTP